MALSERENLILLQLEQSLRGDGIAGARHRVKVLVATAVATLIALGLIVWAAVAPASAWTIAATGVAGVIIGGLAFTYRVPAQAQAIRLYGSVAHRLRRTRLPFRHRRSS